MGAVSNYALSPNGNPLVLFGESYWSVLWLRIICDAVAYGLREQQHPAMSIACHQSGSRIVDRIFYPFVARSMTDPALPVPYAVLICFCCISVALSAIPFNLLADAQSRWMVSTAPVAMSEFSSAPLGLAYIWGTVGGLIRCTGAVFGFLQLARAHCRNRPFPYSNQPGSNDHSCM